MMRDEGACGSASGDALEDGGLHLEAAGGIEVLTHGGHDLGALDEGVFHLRIDDKVYIALAVAHFRVGECIVHHAVHFLHDREHAEALAEHREFLDVDAELAGLGDEGVSLDADYIAYVEELLPHGVVHGLVFAGADFVPLDVDLDAAALVLKFAERRRAHYAAAHDAACEAHVREVTLLGIEVLAYVFGGIVYRI